MSDTSSVSDVSDIHPGEAPWDIESTISSESSFEILSQSDDDSVIEYYGDDEDTNPIVSIDVVEDIDPVTGHPTLQTQIVYSHEVTREEALDLAEEIALRAGAQYGGWLGMPSDLVMTLAGEKPVCAGPARLVHGAIRGW